MVTSISAQDQLAALIADAMPERILSFKFSMSVQERIETLVVKKKRGALSADEQIELDKYLIYDSLVGLAKARAFKRNMMS